MYIIDTHCDALLKLWERPTESYFSSSYIEANGDRLQKGNVRVQFFAIFVEPWVKQDQKFSVVLEQVRLFNESILKENNSLYHIKKWSDLNHLEEHQIGAVLTLEGLDAIGDDLTKLRILYELGVLSVGLTWNEANLCADGVGEPRGAGLSLLGREAVKLNNAHHIMTDVSHLSIKGFWDVIDLADYPVATHSNARSVCDHVRNLYDDQISALVSKKGFIGVVFHPFFLTGTSEAAITDVISHIEHMCELGAEKHIGFGSDFDGIASYVNNLEHAGHFPNLINELLKHYSEEQVRGFAHQNFLNHLPK